MKPSGSQTYTLQRVKESLDSALNSENVQTNFYNGIDGILRIVEGILKTNGTNWSSHIYDEDGKQILTPNEQVDFDKLLKPYIDDIIGIFKGYNQPRIEQDGGQQVQVTNSLKPVVPISIDESDIIATGAKSNISKISNRLTKTKLNAPSNQQSQGFAINGIDNTYASIINKFGKIDNTVKNYASQHGILRLEREQDLKEDIPLLPEPAIASISSALMAATSGAVPSVVTSEILHKMKVPFRTIVIASYLALDMARLSFGLKDYTLSRRIMSILVALIDLLRGDWKKAVLSFVGYFGKAPLVYGEIGKVFLTLYETIDPQIRESMTYGLLDLSKSMIVGTLLTIFQAVAPDFVRLKAIEALETIAQMKAKIDGDLEGAGKSARPDYYAPQYEDFSNIQAVMSDNAMVCSEEFQNAIQTLSMSTLLRLVLDILRIPSNKDIIRARCGPTLKPYGEQLAEEANRRMQFEEQQEEEAPLELQEEQQEQEEEQEAPLGQEQEAPLGQEQEAPLGLQEEQPTQFEEQATKLGQQVTQFGQQATKLQEQATKAKELIPTSIGNAKRKSLKLAKKGLQSMLV